MKPSKPLSILISAALSLTVAHAQKPEEMTKRWESGISESNAQAKAIQNWRDLGFGIFVHWTPAIVFQGRAQGKELDTDLWGEWYMARTRTPVEDYAKRVRTWNPKDFNPQAWAKAFQDAGAKYVVFVAKHHDGFAMFDSKANDYNIAANKDFGRDVFGELCTALRKEGLRTGFYYSHGADWRNRTCFQGTKEEIEKQYWNKIVYTHLRELTSKYGKQDIAWFDLGASKEQAEKCAQIVRKCNPDIMISSRIGHGFGNFSLGGDCDVPIKKNDKPWETCMTFDYHWDWYPAGRADKSSQQLIRMLAAIRARGGNLLLNIGPDIRGVIPLRESVVLAGMGKWLRVNGDSIYAARLTPYNDLPWGVCTMKKGRLFLHLFKLPRLDYAFLPGFKSPVKNAYLLADKEHKALKTEKVEHGYRIYLRDSDPHLFSETDTVVVVEYDGTPEIDPKPVLDLDLENTFLAALGKTANGAATGRKRVKPKPDNPSVEAPHYFDYAWRFATPESTVAWNCITPETSYFYAKVKYANFTDRTLTATVKVGENTVEVPLPPSPKNAHTCIQSALSKAFLLRKSDDTGISFSLSKETLEKPLTGKGPSKLPVFMLESLEVSTVDPPLFIGYGDTDGLVKEDTAALLTENCLAVKDVRADSENKTNPAKFICDKNLSTFWHINFHGPRPPWPHHVDFEFAQPGTIGEVVFFQRNDGTRNGMVKDAELYVSMDGKSWGKPVAKFTLEGKRGKQVRKLEKPVKARFARIKMLAPVDENDPWATMTEIAFRHP